MLAAEPGRGAARSRRARRSRSRSPRRRSRSRCPTCSASSADDAADLIEAAGFRVRGREQKVDTPEGDNVVLEQNPPSGEKRDKGSRVTITIGRFEPENLDPDPGATPSPTP